MTTLATDQTEAFDPTPYEVAGTPRLNGRKADTITLTIEPLELDRTDTDDMNIAGRLEAGELVHITCALHLKRRTYNDNLANTDHDLNVTLRTAILEHAPQ